MSDINDNRPRIMAIDDEVEVITIISDYFTSEGFDIRAFSDARAAFKALGDDPLLPNVILLDIMMPEMDGYEFCRQLQAEPRLADIAVIFLTGKDRIDDALGFLKSGGHLYVKKPFQLLELKNLILLFQEAGLPS